MFVKNYFKQFDIDIALPSHTVYVAQIKRTHDFQQTAIALALYLKFRRYV